MNLFRHVLLMAAIVLAVCGSVQAQTVYISDTFSMVSAHNLDSISNFQFPPGQLQISDTSGNYSLTNLAAIRSIRFSITGVGMAETSKKPGACLVYPNPTNDFLTIRFPQPQLNDTRVSFYSLDSRIINLDHVFSGNGTCVIDAAALPPGMYLCRIFTNSKSETITFIKQ